MTSSDIRTKYLDFFVKNGHVIIPSSSLVPDNDPTTLFTSAGMQPMLPYLLGDSHPLGPRLVDSQKVFRSQDIEEVGDNRHDTFFEMLGNWSLGDYWKKDQLTFLFKFLTKELGLDPSRLYVSVFAGDPTLDLPRDEESAQIWQELFTSKGIKTDIVDFSNNEQRTMNTEQVHIFYYPATKNWWSRAGVPQNMPVGEPGGPDSEVFYEFTDIAHDPKFGPNCHPNCDCGRFLEIGNSVFMQYQKTDTGFVELPRRNVDFGGGLERLTMATSNEPDQFKTDLYSLIIDKLEEELHVKYTSHPAGQIGGSGSQMLNNPPAGPLRSEASGQPDNVTTNLRIIADHIKAATFLIKDGVYPTNKFQGYILRRLLRRSAVKITSIRENSMLSLLSLVDPVIETYKTTDYFKHTDSSSIKITIKEELTKFEKTLRSGLREVEKIDQIDGKAAFDLFQTYGFPLEITEELFLEKGQTIDHAQFESEFDKHRELSQTAAKGLFKGGLQDHSGDTKKHHTATHLLNQALHLVLGDHITQRGSFVSNDKLRFDFSHTAKLTDAEIAQIEEIVNQKIKENLPVKYLDLPKDQAIKTGALHAFNEKYQDICRIYYVGPDLDSAWSKEFCGGPHVARTGQLGPFKITKQESAGSGIRRIYAKVE